MDEVTTTKGISRRSVLKGAAIGLGAAMAGIGLKDAQAALPPPKKWDMETDVVIVGFGGAGAAAAIEAHEAKANVLILEKAPEHLPGGNSGCCAGTFMPPSNEQDGFKYFKALGSGSVTDDELVRTFVKGVMGVRVWLEKWGIPTEVLATEVAGHYEKLPGSKVDNWRVPGGGVEAFKGLLNEIKKRKIKVMYHTPAQRLIQNPVNGEILGLTAGGPGKEISIKARRGVILACGGYENNADMISNYNYPGLKFFPFGTPYNTGDGIAMSMDVGAKQWHFPSMEWMLYGLKAPAEKGCVVPFVPNLKGGSFIFVNRDGKRFANEYKILVHYKGHIATTDFDSENCRYANVPFFAVFDESVKKQGPLVPPGEFLPGQNVGWAKIHKLVQWSSDNSKEIEKGWIKKANTLAELAKTIDVDPAGLEATVRAYNEYKGKDPEFDRQRRTLLPLKTPPFYAVELCPVVINTQGGPVHDSKARVLDMENKPIPRLYAAGELGSFFGHLYQGGNNFPEAIAFGRIAGIHAAKEKPWKKI